MVQHIWWSFVLHFVLSLFSYQKKGVPCLQAADNQTRRRCHNPAKLFTTSVFVFWRRRTPIDTDLIAGVCDWKKTLQANISPLDPIWLIVAVYCWQEYFMQSINWKWLCGFLSNFEDYFHCEDPPLSRRASFKRERTPHSLSRLGLGVLAAAQNTKVRSFSFNLFPPWNTNRKTQKAFNNRFSNVKLSLFSLFIWLSFWKGRDGQCELFCFLL